MVIALCYCTSVVVRCPSEARYLKDRGQDFIFFQLLEPGPELGTKFACESSVVSINARPQDRG